MYEILFQDTNDDYDVELLMDKAFGSMRHEKPIYRFRDDMDAVADLSFVIKKDQKLVASLRFWPAVMFSPSGMDDTILLGPIAVSDDHGCQGLGQQLIEQGIMAAKELGYKSIVLVGDEAYYEKMGFSRIVASSLYIEGFKDYDRLLGLELEEGHLTSKNWLLEPAQYSAAQKAA